MNRLLIVLSWSWFITSFSSSCSRPVALIQRSNTAYYTYRTNLSAALVTRLPTDSSSFVTRFSEPTLVDRSLSDTGSHTNYPLTASTINKNKRLKAPSTTNLADGLTQNMSAPQPLTRVSQQALFDQLKPKQSNGSLQQPTAKRKFLNAAMLFLVTGFLFIFFSKGGLRILGISLQVIGVVLIILGIKLK
ncbi:hypothetical protein [Spirosoma migulaei]